MSRLESIIVGLVVGIACPWLTFVAFWWTAALLHLQAFPVTEGMIETAALTGLGLGCLLDVVFLRRWVENFYTANKWLIVMVYLGLSVVAVGTFMGVPVGTFSLGVAAGAYVGRREYHSRTDGARATTAFRRVAFFSASVTAAAALPIGILAVQSEQQILRSLVATFGLGQNRLQGSGGVVLIGFLCLILWVAQYWSTRTAGRLVFRIGARRHHHQ